MIGDQLLVDAARRVIAGLPPPVRHHLALHPTLRVLGHASGGCASHRSSPRAGADEWPRDLIVVYRHPFPGALFAAGALGSAFLSALALAGCPRSRRTR